MTTPPGCALELEPLLHRLSAFETRLAALGEIREMSARGLADKDARIKAGLPGMPDRTQLTEDLVSFYIGATPDERVQLRRAIREHPNFRWGSGLVHLPTTEETLYRRLVLFVLIDDQEYRDSIPTLRDVCDVASSAGVPHVKVLRNALDLAAGTDQALSDIQGAIGGSRAVFVGACCVAAATALAIYWLS